MTEARQRAVEDAERFSVALADVQRARRELEARVADLEARNAQLGEEGVCVCVKDGPDVQGERMGRVMGLMLATLPPLS